MNEKLQYATMLEIPVNTCTVRERVGRKSKRKSKKVNSDEIKNKLITKINSQEEKKESNALVVAEQESSVQPTEEIALKEERRDITVSVVERKKKKFSFSVIGAQIAVIGVLIGAIFLTNAFYPDSGLNVFFREVFSSGQPSAVDNRTYKDFAPVLAVGGGLNLDGGVITIGSEGSVYSPCDGKVVSVTVSEDGKYSLEIAHGKNFSTTLSGLDYAYCTLGDEVYYNIPVGYTEAGGAKMCFLSGEGAVISDYTIDGNSVIWAV